MLKKLTLLCAVFIALLLGRTALAAWYPESAHPYANSTRYTGTADAAEYDVPRYTISNGTITGFTGHAGSQINYGYFCLSNYAIEAIGCHECYDKPHIATAYKYNYAYRNGELDSIISGVYSAISSGLKKGRGSVEYSRYDDQFTRTAILVLRGKVESIGSKAFANSPNLWQIEIPASVTSIADDAFSGVKGLILFGQSGSAAQSFADAHGFGFVEK